MMSGGLADVFDIVGTDRLLRVGDPVAGRLLAAVEIFFQRRDARVDPQQRRIVMRDQRSSRFNHVTFGLEVVQKHLAYLVAC